jgi:hypothetical protein
VSAALTLAGLRGGGFRMGIGAQSWFSSPASLHSPPPITRSSTRVGSTRLRPPWTRLQDEASRAPGRVLMIPNLAMLFGLYGSRL